MIALRMDHKTRAKLEAQAALDMQHFWQKAIPEGLADIAAEVEARLLEGEPLELETLKDMADRSFADEHDIALGHGIDL